MVGLGFTMILSEDCPQSYVFWVPWLQLLGEDSTLDFREFDGKFFALFLEYFFQQGIILCLIIGKN